MFFYNIIKLNITLILCRFNSIYKNHFNKQIHNLTQYMERRSLHLNVILKNVIFPY